MINTIKNNNTCKCWIQILSINPLSPMSQKFGILGHAILSCESESFIALLILDQ